MTVYGYMGIWYSVLGGDTVAVSEAHKRASYKWNASRDNIMIRPDKEEGQRIRDAAAAVGQSVQGYVLEAVREKLERESPGE